MIDRELYKKNFSKGSLPQWQCPTCYKGVLVGIAGTFHCEESSESRSAFSHDDWEPDWIHKVYSCQFKCSNPSCQEVVASIGTGGVDFFSSIGDFNESDNEYFTPKFFIPNLRLFRIPESVPLDVSTAIDNSFSALFSSPSGASSYLRIALERILDYLKVKKTTINKQGKRTSLALTVRIEHMPPKYALVQESCRAVKWIGNVGSHSSEILSDDIMDAYDIFIRIIDEVFEKKTHRLQKLEKQINTSKGVRGKRNAKKVDLPF